MLNLQNISESNELVPRFGDRWQMDPFENQCATVYNARKPKFVADEFNPLFYQVIAVFFEP